MCTFVSPVPYIILGDSFNYCSFKIVIVIFIDVYFPQLIFLMPFTFALPPLRQSLNDSYNSIKESFSDAWDSLARKIEKRYYDAGDWVTQKLRGTIVKLSKFRPLGV